jgi:uroporphyrinogen-III synthase
MPVVVTRPARDAQRWVERLRQAGIAAEPLPLLAIGPAPELRALEAARTALPGYAAVMFVSANAVLGLLADGLSWPPSGPRAWAPGPATVDALREYGVSSALIDAPAAEAPQFDSESLWAEVAGQLKAGDRLLLVRGADATGRSQGRDWLAARLAEAGVRVDTVASYSRGVPAWDATQLELARRNAGADSLWLFSSSEAAANLRRLWPQGDWSSARALATHPRIAEAVRALGFGAVRECRPAFEDVVASIESIR